MLLEQGFHIENGTKYNDSKWVYIWKFNNEVVALKLMKTLRYRLKKETRLVKNNFKYTTYLHSFSSLLLKNKKFRKAIRE